MRETLLRWSSLHAGLWSKFDACPPQANGEFPQRVPITAHCVGWIESEVQAWLNQRASTRPVATPVSYRPLTTRNNASTLS
jgi:hypothetical protein